MKIVIFMGYLIFLTKFVIIINLKSINIFQLVGSVIFTMNPFVFILNDEQRIIYYLYTTM